MHFLTNRIILQAKNRRTTSWLYNFIPWNNKYDYTPLLVKGLSYLLKVLYAPKLEGTKHPGFPLVGPTGRNKAATPQKGSE